MNMLRFFAGLAAIGLSAMSTPAQAGGFTASVDTGAVLLEQSGYDLALRAGWTIDFANFHITPEIAERLLATEQEPYVGTFAGARISHGHVISPGIYSMVGVWTYDGSSTVTGGVSIDLRAIPGIVAGVHSGYSTHVAGGFMTVGGHVGFEM
jgi:hypothetical protein